jgi:hypothetical protein
MYKELNIHPVNHGTRKADKNRFCGPAVISALTGLTTMDGSRLIRAFSQREAITGTTEREVRNALGACGIRMVDLVESTGSGFEKNITLARFLKISSEWRQSRVFLICAGRHWQLVQGRRFVCGQTEAVVGFKHPRVHRRSRVGGVWMLTASEGLKMPKELLEAKKAQKKREIERKSALQKKRQLLVLCNQHNLDVDCDDDLWDRGGESRYWFSFSEQNYEKIIDEREERGENDVERYAYGLDEALEKAFEMIELKKTL